MLDIRDIQILAIKSAEQPDWGDIYRTICREYSEKYHTPLHIVENELDQEYVLSHYYEDLFQDLFRKSKEDEKVRQSYNELRLGILDPDKAEKQINEDDAWAQEMLNKLEQEGSFKSLNEPKTTENPNIIKKIEDDEFEISQPGEE